MFLISFSSTKILSWCFLKIKTPSKPEGNSLKYFFKAEYPCRRNKFLTTAFLLTVFGEIKEIRGEKFSRVKINLKLRAGELTTFPALKSFSIFFLSILFFLGSIIYNLKKTIRKAWPALFFFSLKGLFCLFCF
jgi:hypothetical protein